MNINRVTDQLNQYKGVKSSYISIAKCDLNACSQNKNDNIILVKQRLGETLFTVRPKIVHERSKLAISGLIE